MNLIRLARTAVDAEIRRTKLAATRTGRRVALAAAGAVMFALVGILIQVAIIVALNAEARIALLWSVLITAGGDLLVGIVLLLIAQGSGVKAPEVSAKMRRDQAVAELRQAMTIAALSGPVLRMGTKGAGALGRFVLQGNRRRGR